MKRNSSIAFPWLGSLTVSGILIFSHSQVLAQVTPDNTLGDESSVVNTRDATSESIDGGAVRGQNLFHSFEEFNVGEDRGVYFANPDAVTNIFSRVTGNNVSNILGTLGVDGAANLFLINPNGIVFGKGASLDVQGSFAATTADGIEFGDRGFFSAVNPESPSLLTINPSAYLFNQVAPGAIANNSRANNNGLQVQPGKSLFLIGGDITLDGGIIFSPGGRVHLGGLNTAGIIGINADSNLSFPENVTRADVSITNNSFVAVSLAEGGKINVNARNLELFNSFLLAGLGKDLASSEARAADIELNATEKIKIEGNLPGLMGTSIINNGGNITITTGSLEGVGNFNLNSISFGEANSGNITITAKESISLLGTTDNTFIGSSPDLSATGNAGDITVATPSLSLFNISIGAGSNGQGNAGNIQINTTDSISLNNSFITASSLGDGNAGDITIESEKGNVSFDGTKVGVIAVPALGISGKGESGDIIIRGQSILFSNGTILTADNDGQKNAGNISLEADKDINLNGMSQIFSNTGGQGKGGNVNITAESLSIKENSQISSNTFGDGDAGSVDVTTRTLSIKNGGGINANTFSRGNAGNVDITAIDSVNLSQRFIATQANSETSGNASNMPIATIGANVGSKATGIGGNVNIETGNLTIADEAIVSSASEGQKQAGNINLNIGKTLEVNSGEISTSSTQSAGGAINIITEDIRLRGDSDIRSNIFSGAGGGGNINITADSIIAFDDSDIFAFAADGRGGNITLDTPAFFAENFTLNSLTAENTQLLENNNRADVNATGNQPGIVSIPDLSFIQNGLNNLPNNSINTDELVANSCVVPVGDRKKGKFFITGTESFPLRPGDALPSKYPTGEVRNVPEKHNSWQPGDPIVEPQGAYRLANGKLVLSRECSN